MQKLVLAGSLGIAALIIAGGIAAPNAGLGIVISAIVVALMAGLLGIVGALLLGASAAMLRVVTDTAVSVIPGLSDDERLHVMEDRP